MHYLSIYHAEVTSARFWKAILGWSPLLFQEGRGFGLCIKHQLHISSSTGKNSFYTFSSHTNQPVADFEWQYNSKDLPKLKLKHFRLNQKFDFFNPAGRLFIDRCSMVGLNNQCAHSCALSEAAAGEWMFGTKRTESIALAAPCWTGVRGKNKRKK